MSTLVLLVAGMWHGERRSACDLGGQEGTERGKQLNPLPLQLHLVDVTCSSGWPEYILVAAGGARAARTAVNFLHAKQYRGA